MNSPFVRTSRRRFLQTALVASALPAWYLEQLRAEEKSTASKSANSKPGIALIGCGGRGQIIAKQASEFGNIVALCDVDSRQSEAAAQKLSGTEQYKDFRKVLERKDVDIILNGTPDHWHTLVNLAALHAGKDIYSEKPLTLTIDEGKMLVKHVKQTKRILQTGSQQKSDARFRLACELVRNGRIGKVLTITAAIGEGPKEGPFTAEAVPSELDWDFWQGPAPKADYTAARCHKTFRWFWEYSGGRLTDWGAHHNDIAQWALGAERSGPITVEGVQLEEMIPDGFTTPSKFRVEYKYANDVLMICTSEGENGVTFIGSEGSIFVSRSQLIASRPEILTEPLPAGATKLYYSDNHMGNFFACVQSRRQPICDAEIGHRSATVCHLGNISMRLGRKLVWNPLKEEFIGDSEANAMCSRPQRRPWDSTHMI